MNIYNMSLKNILFLFIFVFKINIFCDTTVDINIIGNNEKVEHFEFKDEEMNETVKIGDEVKKIYENDLNKI